MAGFVILPDDSQKHRGWLISLGLSQHQTIDSEQPQGQGAAVMGGERLCLQRRHYRPRRSTVRWVYGDRTMPPWTEKSLVTPTEGAGETVLVKDASSRLEASPVVYQDARAGQIAEWGRYCRGLVRLATSSVSQSMDCSFLVVDGIQTTTCEPFPASAASETMSWY